MNFTCFLSRHLLNIKRTRSQKQDINLFASVATSMEQQQNRPYRSYRCHRCAIRSLRSFRKSLIWSRRWSNGLGETLLPPSKTKHKFPLLQQHIYVVHTQFKRWSGFCPPTPHDYRRHTTGRRVLCTGALVPPEGAAVSCVDDHESVGFMTRTFLVPPFAVCRNAATRAFIFGAYFRCVRDVTCRVCLLRRRTHN